MRIRHLAQKTRAAVTWLVVYLMVINSAASFGLACQSWSCGGTYTTSCYVDCGCCCEIVVCDPCPPVCGVVSSCVYETMPVVDCCATSWVDVGCEPSVVESSVLDEVLSPPAEESLRAPSPATDDTTAFPAPDTAETGAPDGAEGSTTRDAVIAPAPATTLPPPTPTSPADITSEFTPAPTLPESTPPDIFSDELPDMPAEPAVDPDVRFGEVPAEIEPAKAADATDNAVDDLFGEMPTEEAAEPPAPLPEDSGFNDLFDEAPAEDPAEDPAATTDESVDDLFGETPAEEPQETPAATDDFPSFDEAEPAPTEETPEPDAALDDLFGATTSPRGADEGQLPLRTWTDNTGNFSTVGQLVEMGENHVRLRKENGRLCTVPHRRLSDDDFSYVQRLTVEMGQTVVRLAVR